MRNNYGTAIPPQHHGREGAIHELNVEIDLLRRGWQVFVPVYAAKGVDMVATKGIATIKVQVKKARVNRTTGRLMKNTVKHPDMYDILALSLDGPQIVYQPPLPDVQPLPGEDQEDNLDG